MTTSSYSNPNSESLVLRAAVAAYLSRETDDEGDLEPLDLDDEDAVQ
jgi:hypothetical protein